MAHVENHGRNQRFEPVGCGRLAKPNGLQYFPGDKCEWGVALAEDIPSVNRGRTLADCSGRAPSLNQSSLVDAGRFKSEKKGEIISVAALNKSDMRTNCGDFGGDTERESVSVLNRSDKFAPKRYSLPALEIKGVSSIDPHDLSTRASRRAARRAENQKGYSAGGVNRLDYSDREGRSQNCAKCALATDLTLSGQPACANRGGVTERDDVSTLFGYPRGKGWFFVADKAHIECLLKMWGARSRAVVFARRSGEQGGHYFNVINQRGAIRFIDGQTGRAPRFSAGFIDYQLLRTDKIPERFRR